MASIEKRGESYKIIASDGYTTTGQKMRKTMTWKPAPGMTQRQIEKELQRQALLFDEAVKSGAIANSGMKFAAYKEIWFAQHATPNLAPKTALEYGKLWPRIDKALGHIRLDKIRPMHLQQFYTNLQEDGMNTRTKGRLSPATIIGHHRMLSSMFTYAVQMGLLADNPARRVRPPKNTAQEAAYLTEEQALTMLEALKQEPIQFRAMIETLLYVGMRKSELHGLRWKDLDVSTGVLKIERELQYIQKQGLLERPPKNRSSIRAVKLASGLLETLQTYKEWQTVKRLALGDYWPNDDWIFTTDEGKPRHPDTLPKQFKTFLEKCGLPKGIHLHTLRHSCASFLIGAGVDLRTVAKRLGHAQVSTTSNIYAHQIRSADEAAAKALDLILTRKTRRRTAAVPK
jgi:integrase